MARGTVFGASRMPIGCSFLLELGNAFRGAVVRQDHNPDFFQTERWGSLPCAGCYCGRSRRPILGCNGRARRLRIIQRPRRARFAVADGLGRL
jgi:hypothetical protein